MFSPLHHKTLVILRPKTNIPGLLSGKYMPRKIVGLRFCDTRQTLSKSEEHGDPAGRRPLKRTYGYTRVAVYFDLNFDRCPKCRITRVV